MASTVVTTLGGKPIMSVTPDKITIYDKAGNSIERFPVDAREIVARGEYSYEKPIVAGDDDSERQTDTNADGAGAPAEPNDDAGSADASDKADGVGAPTESAKSSDAKKPVVDKAKKPK